MHPFQRNFSFTENFMFQQPFKKTGEIYRPSERQIVILFPGVFSLKAEKRREPVNICQLYGLPLSRIKQFG